MLHKISVIMLTYNRETFIGKMIDSVLAQTFRNFEFIIVDNGSTDQSGEIAKEYARQDPRIRVIRTERGNIGSGRNAGLKAASGEYVAFVDDDDICEPDFLEFLLCLAVENNAEVSICGGIKWENGKGTPVGIVDKPFVMDSEIAIIELLWRKRYNNGFPTKLFKHSMFTNLLFPETGLYDDIYVMYKMLANARRVVSFGLPKYNIYRHESNNSIATTKHGMISAEYLEEYRTVYRERTYWLCEKFPSNCDYWWYFDWSFQISMVDKILEYNPPTCEIHLKEMEKELFVNAEKFLKFSYTLDFEKRWIAKYITAESD